MYKHIVKILENANSELMRLSLLGMIAGILSALVVVAFRYLIESTQASFLPGADPENYEALPTYAFFLLPFLGGILLGLIFHFVPADKRQVGVVHAMDYVKNNAARLPVFNLVLQFISAAISIIAGHSVGREGPSVHLGASSGSLIARLFNQDNVVARILLACGVSAAIAASFNTPIAGVIFALEVIMLEYTVMSIMPIIISAIIATMISHAVFGNESAFQAPALEIISHAEYIGITLNGIFIGLIAALFIHLLVYTTTVSKPYPIFWRLTLAGTITGLLAVLAPEIMSLGYDTINATFQSEFVFSALILILIFKLFATSVGLGLGLPAGLIGPTLVIGALAGSVVGSVIQAIYPDAVSSVGLYAMIGMGAMMGATLQAPLAALTAIFELTLNPGLILPGLIAIVVASLTSSELFKKPSIFLALIAARESEAANQVETEFDKQTPVKNVLSHDFVIFDELSTWQKITAQLEQNINWVLVNREEKTRAMITRRALEQFDFEQSELVNLMTLDLPYYRIAELNASATIDDALTLFNQSDLNAVYITQNEVEDAGEVLGILCREDVSNYINHKLT